MKLTLESTDRIIAILPKGRGSLQARVWEGRTESGIQVQALIAEVAVPVAADQADFERELKDSPNRPPAMPDAWPLRFFLD